jgi:hypothetical protein
MGKFVCQYKGLEVRLFKGGTMEWLWMLWAATGGAISMAIMIRIWLPDPPPPFLGKFTTVFVAGIVGGVLGGVGFGSHGSNPMPVSPDLCGLTRCQG